VPHQANKFAAEVLPGGKIELTTPLTRGRVEVLVIGQETDESQDLRDAAALTLRKPEGLTEAAGALLIDVEKAPAPGDSALAPGIKCWRRLL
jgi:hypothetical protein